MARMRFRPTDESHSVTTLELFFDLVFVFAFTQVTQLMADDPTAVGALRGVVLLALLWWAWCSYAWLGNQAHADEGVVRFTLVLAMISMFLVALAVPESFEDLPGGLSGPVVLALCYGFVRVAHLSCYVIAAGDDTELRRKLAVTAVPVTAAVLVLLAGALVGPPWQALLWASALVVDYVGIWVVGSGGWRLNSARHFAERHGLIVLVAIGESLVAIGVGVAQQPVSWPVVVAAALGVALATSLWWLYFDVVAHVGEETLARATGEERARLARDSYTYLHFPIVVSIIFVALGLKKVLEYVADSEHHDLTDPLKGMPLLALVLGVVVYLLGHVGFRRRNVGSWNPHRTVAAVVLVLLLPVLWRTPALGSMAVVTAVLVGLVAYETVRFREAREHVRHGPHAA